MRNDRVFTYGTLRAGQPNAYLLNDAAYMGSHRTSPTYRLFDTGHYPAALTNGHTAITGEVYAINACTLAMLDRLEGYPQLYNRRQIPTLYGHAWIYLWAADVAPAWRAIDGDWCRYRRAHS